MEVLKMKFNKEYENYLLQLRIAKAFNKFNGGNKDE